jgi:protocatechuate 4,5-dioxygenase alpha chain
LTERYDGIPGTYVFDLATSRRGYELNRLGISLTKPENRAACLADEDAYLDRFALSPEARAAVKARDWLTLVRLGANIYYIYKLTGLRGVPARMSDLGAAQVGLSPEEFTRQNLERGRAGWPG